MAWDINVWCWGLQNARLKMSPRLGGQVVTFNCDSVTGNYDMCAGHGQLSQLILV